MFWTLFGLALACFSFFTGITTPLTIRRWPHRERAIVCGVFAPSLVLFTGCAVAGYLRYLPRAPLAGLPHTLEVIVVWYGAFAVLVLAAFAMLLALGRVMDRVRLP